MASIALSIGVVVAETYEGHYRHREYHGDQNLKAKLLGVPAGTLIRKPRWLWRARKGKIIEVQARWWGQEGYDVKVQWNDGSDPEWYLADTEHLRLIKKGLPKKNPE